MEPTNPNLGSHSGATIVGAGVGAGPDRKSVV